MNFDDTTQALLATMFAIGTAVMVARLITVFREGECCRDHALIDWLQGALTGAIGTPFVLVLISGTEYILGGLVTIHVAAAVAIAVLANDHLDKDKEVS